MMLILGNKYEEIKFLFFFLQVNLTNVLMSDNMFLAIALSLVRTPRKGDCYE